MKKLFLLSFLTLILTPALSGTAQAGQKFLGIWWWESHWKNQDFIPYYDNGTDPHTTQWTDKNWTPADWIKVEGGDGTKLVQKWLNADILEGSYKDRHNVPYLEVGRHFYYLSGYDKRRVLQTLDAVYQVTSQKPGMFFIKDPQTDKIIGTYSKDGLTLE
jgi:hypothetical protein